jgi:DNA-binding CsgD family transcriptional regulator
MDLQSYLTPKERIYITSLQEIDGIKFTFREIDIIACIVNNRGDKKIAFLLSITPRTVGSHLYNIMNKIGTSSREYVIDFIEKAGKLQYLRQYYSHILAHSLANRKLIQINKILKDKPLNVQIILDENNTREIAFTAQLIKYLSQANINLIKNKAEKANAPYNLYIIDTISFQDAIFTDEAIFLLINSRDQLLPINKAICIDFSQEKDFYISIFKLVGSLIDKPSIREIIAQFQSEYLTGQNSLADYKFTDNISNSFNIYSKNPLRYAVLFLSVIIASFALWYFIKGSQSHITNNIDDSPTMSMLGPKDEVESFLRITNSNGFSSNNLIKDKMQKNYSTAKQIEKFTLHLNNPKTQSYLTNTAIPAKTLLEVIYHLQALSAYYIHNEYDGEKSRVVLLQAKNLLESYISNYSKLKIDFNKLNKDEIYAELLIIKDFPEIYTRIIYALGRTYLFHGDKAEALKYFELAEYMGNKEGIFEGYLSRIRGIAIIQHFEIEKDLKNAQYDKARKQILELIELYKKSKSIDKDYILDYKPSSENHTLINPIKDHYNQIAIGEKLVQYYANLITITDDINQKSKYLKEIIMQLSGTKENPSILSVSEELTDRKITAIYNTLGNVMLQLDDSGLDLQVLQTVIIEKLQLKKNEISNLEIAGQIFELAKSSSKTSDYTKADAYDGLIKIYSKKLEIKDLAKDKIDQLSNQILKLKQTRDEINSKLKRVIN